MDMIVLILVLMEYGLRGLGKNAGSSVSLLVLILVLMEYGLRALAGVRSRCTDAGGVLILVLMEYGLRDPVPFLESG